MAGVGQRKPVHAMVTGKQMGRQKKNKKPCSPNIPFDGMFPAVYIIAVSSHVLFSLVEKKSFGCQEGPILSDWSIPISQVLRDSLSWGRLTSDPITRRKGNRKLLRVLRTLCP